MIEGQSSSQQGAYPFGGHVKQARVAFRGIIPTQVVVETEAGRRILPSTFLFWHFPRSIGCQAEEEKLGWGSSRSLVLSCR